MGAVGKAVALVVIGAVSFLLLDTEENRRRFRRWRRVADRWARRALDELRGAGRPSVDEARDLYSMVDLTAAFAAGMDTSGWDALAIEQRDEVLAFLQDARVYAERLVESTKYPLTSIEVEHDDETVTNRIREILAEAGLPAGLSLVCSGDVQLTSTRYPDDGLGALAVLVDPSIPPGTAEVRGPTGALEGAILGIDLGDDTELRFEESPSLGDARISGGGQA